MANLIKLAIKFQVKKCAQIESNELFLTHNSLLKGHSNGDFK